MNVSGERPVRVAIVDDETLLAKTLGSWLERDPGLKVAGYAASGNQGWELCLATQPDVALVDVEMEDGDGITLARRLLERFPEIRVMIMTGRVDPHTAWLAGQARVQGLIDKTIDPESLCRLIHLLMAGGRVLSPAFQRIKEEWLMEPEAFQKVLTNRELAVLLRVTEGQADLDIGQKLGISIETVASHRKSIRKKLDLHDDRSLVAYGRQWGIYGTSG